MILAKISTLEIVLYILMAVAIVLWTVFTILGYKKKQKKGKNKDEEED